MIKNILFDMGNVLIRFDRNYFLDRLGICEEDKQLLMREVFLSVEWVQMDRGNLCEETAAASCCRSCRSLTRSKAADASYSRLISRRVMTSSFRTAGKQGWVHTAPRRSSGKRRRASGFGCLCIKPIRFWLT